MKIQLQKPYSDIWREGYLVTNKENRKMILLVGKSDERSTTSYARYLLSVNLCRFLLEEETVDHIDGDKTNDSIDNLQILSREDNIRKSSKKITMVSFICDFCKKSFSLPKRQTYGKRKTRCCSRICSASIQRERSLMAKQRTYTPPAPD